MSRLFRGKYISLLRHAYKEDRLCFTVASLGLGQPQAFSRLLDQLMSKDWVVYNKPPFGGPKQVLDYLGRYTHRVAIANQRILAIEGTQVRFAYRDYTDRDKCKTMALEATELTRRFLLHVLPPGFMHFRHVGLLANRRKKAKLTLARQCLGQPEPPVRPVKSTPELMLRLTGFDIMRCPHCLNGRWQPLPIPPTGLDHRRAGAPDTS